MAKTTALRHIEPPNRTDRPAALVAREVVELIRREYRYNTKDLCAFLHCERQWVDRYLQPEVEHIFLTPYFQRYILEQLHFSDDREEERLRDRIGHGYYFFSAASLQDYWRTHAYAQRRTVQIDLAPYRAKGVSVDQLARELKRHGRAKVSAKEKARHREAMERLLTEKGYGIFLRSGERSQWTPCPLPELSDRLPLLTLASYRRAKGLGSDTAAMKQLLRRGCIRIKLGSRSLWVADQNDFRCPLTVPVEAAAQRQEE